MKDKEDNNSLSTQQQYKENHRVNNNNITERKCTACGEWKEENIDNFYLVNKKNPNRFTPECKKCAIIRSSKRRIEKFDVVQDYMTKYWRDHHDELYQYAQDYKNEHREYYRELSRKFRKTENGRLKAIEYNKTRKSKKHKMSDQEWVDCKEYFKNENGEYCCAYCGMTEEEHKKQTTKGLHREHVIYNGRNDIKNCIPSCHNCNRAKDDKSFNMFYNKENPNYTYERYHKIYLWLKYDCLNYIEAKDIKTRNRLKKLGVTGT